MLLEHSVRRQTNVVTVKHINHGSIPLKTASWSPNHFDRPDSLNVDHEVDVTYCFLMIWTYIITHLLTIDASPIANPAPNSKHTFHGNILCVVGQSSTGATDLLLVPSIKFIR